MPRANKKIVCRVRVDDQAKAVEFTWSEGSASFKPYSLEGEQVSDLRANVQVARDCLFGLVQLHELPLDQRAPVSYRQACLDLARAGHDLYNQVFDTAACGENVGTIAEWFRDVTRSGQVESLEVVCDGQPWFAPWNLLYDEEPEESAFDGTLAGFAPFWGYRYNVCGGQPVDPLRRMPLPTKPQVLVVIDPVVLDDLRGYKNADGTNQRDRMERFLTAQELTPVTSKAELERALKQQRPHMIYWLGHAEPDALHLGRERIDQVALRNLLRNMKRVPGQTGGLVFLNACRTAESGDLGSFLKTFHQAEFSGLIATEEQTLDTFANPFGLDVLEQFFTPGTSIGTLLRNLRQNYGPLGLLYGAYCPPDLQVRLAEEPGAASEMRLVEDMTRAGGRMLGGSRAAAAEGAPVTHDRPLPDAPYLPLDSYGKSHRPLFIGRDDDIARFAMILDRPESRVVVLHGQSGVGKSSFLRAGLIPYLEEECIGYRFLRSRTEDERDESASPVLFIRATDDPTGQIAQTLVEFAARPLEYTTPTGDTVIADLPAALAAELGVTQPLTAADLSQRLLADTSLLARVLGRLSHDLPVTPVLVIDQAEEMFTLARSPVDAWSRDRVLEMIRQVGDGRGDFKLIVSLRTEYYGRLVSTLRRGLAEADGVREYLLTDLDEPAMVEVIRRPTLRERLPHAAEIPFEKYKGFDYADGMPEEIARQVAHHGRTDGVALLLQVICAQLFERAMAREDHGVSADDLREIGGFEGALRRHVERQIRSLFRDSIDDLVHPTGGAFGRSVALVMRTLSPAARNDRERFQMLLTFLTLRQVDGTMSTALLRECDLRRLWQGRSSFDELLPHACDLRLLRTTTRRLESGNEERLISLGHDALAKVAEPWKRELEQKAERQKWRNRGLLATAAAILFAALTFEAVRDRDRAVQLQNDAKAQEAKAIQSAKEARANATKAKIASARASDSARNASDAAKRAEHEAETSRQNLARLYILDGTRLLDEGNSRGALLLFTEALALDQKDPRRVEMHRRRIGAILQNSPKSPQTLFQDRPVNHAEFSPDGRRVVTACMDKTAWLLDAATGKPTTPPLKHGDSVRSASFSPDGLKVVTISDDRTVRLWNAETGESIGKPLVHEGVVHCAAFSPDSRRLVTTGDEPIARIWDVDTGKLVVPSLRHGGEIWVAAFSPDGHRVATASYDKTARVWDAATGRPITSPLLHPNWVDRVAFSPDSRSVVTGCRDHAARVWNAATGNALCPPLQHPADIRRVSFSPDGHRVVTVTKDETRMWAVATGKWLSLPVRATWAYYPSYSRDGRYHLYASQVGQSTRIEDLATGKPDVLTLQNSGVFWDASFSPDGRRLVTGSDDKTAMIWDVNTGEPICPALPHSATVEHAVWSQDGSRVITVSNDEARVWDASTGKPLSPPLKHHARIASACFSPEGRRVVTASADQTAQVWDSRTGAKVGPALKHDNDLMLAVFSPDGSRVLTASRDNTARLWDPITGRQCTPSLRHTGMVMHAAFSADGRRVVTSSEDRTARVWNAVTGEPISPPLRTSNVMVRATLSPDGRFVATAGYDFAARVWDARTGEPLTPAIKHGGIVRTVSFSPDGRLLLTTSDDKTARVWDAATGEPVSPPLKHSGWVRHAIFSADGTRVLTATSARKIGTWDLPRDDRPVPDLLLLAHLISGARLDPASGLVDCDPATLQRAWQRLRALYPDSFTCSANQALSWHRQEAYDAEEAGIWPAVSLHLQALLDAEPGSGSLHARLGRALMESRQWPQARKELDRAIALHAPDPHVWYNRGRVQAHLGRWQGARDDYRRFLEVHPDDGPAWLCRHLADAHLSDWDNANADYARAVEHTQAIRPRVDCWWNSRHVGASPAHTERWREIALGLKGSPKPGKAAWWAWRAQALAEAASGRWKEADSSFSRAIEGKSDDWESWRGRGRARAELSQWNQAASDCSRAIELKEGDWGSWYVRGIVYSRLGLYDKGVSDLSRAIELGANGWGVWADRGFASLGSQDPVHGLSDYTEVIRRNPDATSYNNRGVAYLRVGEFDKAILDFNEAIRLNPRSSYAFANRGESYRKKGDYARTIDDSTEAIRLDPKFSPAYQHRGDAYADKSEFDRAIDDYTEALALSPGNTYTLRRRAAAYLARKNLGGAIDDYTELLHLIPSDVDTYIARGIAYQNNEEYGKAIEDCAEAMRRDPQRVGIWSKVFKSADDKVRAEKFLRETLARQAKAAADFPTIADHRQKQASTQINLGRLYKGAGHLQEAEDAYRRALDIRQELADHFPEVTGYWEDLARSHTILASFMTENGRAPEGERLYRQAVVLWRKLAKESPGEPRYREGLAQGLDDLGGALRDSGKPADAEEWIREAGELRQGLAGEFHEEARYQQDLFRGLVRLTNLLKANRRLDEAEKTSGRAVAILVKLADRSPKEPVYQQDLARSYIVRGDLLLAMGRAEESFTAFRQAVAVRARLAAQFPQAPDYQNQLAWLLAICPDPRCRDVPRAVDLAQKAVARAPKSGNYWNTLGVALYRKGDWKGAIKALEKSMELRFGGVSYDWFFLAMARWQLGEKEQARKDYERAVAGMAKDRTENGELGHFRDEASALLGMPQSK